jgi:precorrin-6A/cobalt-precorrin-6A reductase
MRVLILGGTTEAALLARHLAGRPGFEVETALAGRTRRPAALPGRVRIGGFGGIEGLLAHLEAARVERLVDATHPFAARIGVNAAAACIRARVPRLRLLRPPWERLPGDLWHEIADMEDAVALLPRLGRRVLVTTGQTGLAQLAASGLELVVRSIEQPHVALPGQCWIGARGPFTFEDEHRLLREQRIEVVLAKASGGEATYAKIEAARALQLPVVLLRRPPPPPGPTVATVAEALAWLGGAP